MQEIEKLKDIVSGVIARTPEIKIAGVQSDNGHAMIVLETDPALGGEMETLRRAVEQAVTATGDFTKVSVILSARRAAKSSGRTPSRAAQIENLAPGIKHVIAVASGKGGVGKSTVAVNLAAALAAQGLRAGLMDADIYGPSVPAMLGLEGRPDTQDGKLVPPEIGGLKVMSMGFLVESDAPMIWRGPMIQTALRQFLQDVAWGDLDILVVDMPPGTGDAQLTMAQKVPLAGAVIVSTPQDIALLDARKGINMFRQVGVPVLGVIENMSYHTCTACGHEDHIFGHGGAKAAAQKLSCHFLGALPLDIDIRIHADAGTPIVTEAPESAPARQYRAMAHDISEMLLSSPNDSPRA